MPLVKSSYKIQQQLIRNAVAAENVEIERPDETNELSDKKRD